MLGGAFGFRHVVPELVSAGHRVVVVEMLGTGASGRPGRADYTLEGHAARAAEVLDRAGVRGAIVVGHSIGASVAMRLSLVRPDLVRRIVSINGGPAEQAGTPGLRAAMRFAPIVRLLGAGRARRQIHSGLQTSSADPGWVTDEVVDGYTAGYADDFEGAIRALRGFASAREREPLVPRLGDIDVPVLLLIGIDRQPGSVADDQLALMRDGLDALHIEAVKGTGQYIHEERPDAVVRAIIGTMANGEGARD
jgi:pimeloyl-ACP methyl ester carboxylesterase